MYDRDRRERYDSEERTNLSSLIVSKTGQMFSDGKKKRDSEDFERASIHKKRLSEEFARERDRKLERHLSHGSKDGIAGSPGSTKMMAPKHIPDVIAKSKHNKRKVSKHGAKRTKKRDKKDQPYDPFDDMGQSESSSDSSSSGSSSSDSDSDLDTDNSSHHPRSGSRAGLPGHVDVSSLQREKDQLIKMLQRLDDGSESVDEDGNRRPSKRARIEDILDGKAGRDSPRVARLLEVDEQIKMKEAALYSSLGCKPDSSLSLRKQMEARRKMDQNDPKNMDIIPTRPRSKDPLGLMSPQFNEPMEVDEYNSGPEKSPREVSESFGGKKKRRDTIDDGHKSRRYRTKHGEDMYSSGDEDTASHKSSSSSVRPRLSFEGRKSGFESEGSTKSENHDRPRSNSKTEVIVPLYVIGPDCPQDPRTPRSPERDRRDNPISLPLPKFGRHMHSSKVGASPRTVPVTKPLTVTIHNTPTTASAPVSATSLTMSPHASPGSLGMVSPTFSPDENASPKLQLSPPEVRSKMEGARDGPDDLDEPPPPPPPPPPGKQAYVEAYITSQQQLQQEMQQQAAGATAPFTPDKDNVFTVPSTDTTPKDTTPKSAERDPRKRRDSQTGSAPAVSPVPSRTTSESDPGEPTSPGRPSLEERIRALDEKLNITQTAVQNTTKAVSTTTVMDYREKFKSKIKKKGEPSQFDKSTVGTSAAEPSDIVKSLLSRKSIFDQDSRRLENIDEKYEPKEGQRNLFRASFSGESLPGQIMQQAGMSPTQAAAISPALPSGEAPRFPASILRNKEAGMLSPGAPPSSAPPAFMGTAPAPPQSELLPQSMNSGLDMFPFLNPGLPKQNSDPTPPSSQPVFRKPSVEAVKHSSSSSGTGSKSSSQVKKENAPLVVTAPSGPNVSPVPVRQESAEGAGSSVTSATPPLPATPTTPTSILKKESAFAPLPTTPVTPTTPVSTFSGTVGGPSVTKKEVKDSTSTTVVKKESNNNSSGSSGLLGKRKASDDNTSANHASNSAKEKQKSDSKGSHSHKSTSSSSTSVKTENKPTDEPENKKSKMSSSSSNSKDKDKKQEPSSKSSSSHKDSSKKSSTSGKHSSSSTKSPEKKHKPDSDKKEGDKQKSAKEKEPVKDKDPVKDKPKQDNENKSKESETKCKPDKTTNQSNERKGDKKDGNHSKTKLGDTKHKDKSKDGSTSSQEKTKGGGSGKSEDKSHKGDKHKGDKHHSRDHSTDKSKTDHSDKKDSKSEKSKNESSHKGDKSKSDHNSDKKGEQKDSKSSGSKESKQSDKKLEKSSSKDTGGSKAKHVKEKELKDKGGEDRGKSNTHQSSSDKKKTSSSSGDKDKSDKAKDKAKHEKVSRIFKLQKDILGKEDRKWSALCLEQRLNKYKW